MRASLVFCAMLAVSGCRLDAKFRGASDAATEDLAGVDLAGVDLAGADLAAGPDLALESDLAGPQLGSFAVNALSTTVKEHESFTVEVTAQDTTGATLTGYAGTITVTSDWGDLKLGSTPAFSNGVAAFAVSLNRETNAANLARVHISDGAATGQTSLLTVTAPLWVQDDAVATALIKPNTSLATNWNYELTNAPPSLVWNGTSFVFYYDGRTQAGVESIGRATSPDFTGSWGFPSGSILSRGTGWDASYVGSPAVVFDQATYVMIYSGGGPTISGLGLATSTDGATYTKFGTGPVIVSTSDLQSQHVVLDQPGIIRLFARGYDGATFGCTATSSDAGKTWSTITRLTGLDLGSKINSVKAAVKEGSVYKLWYSVLSGEQRYATSSDGVSWVASPSNPLALIADTAVWNETANRFDGMIECYGTTTNWCRGHRP